MTLTFESFIALRAKMTENTDSKLCLCNNGLDGGFKCFIFAPNPGEIIQFDVRIFFYWVGSTTN